jgi:hypothetical protein
LPDFTTHPVGQNIPLEHFTEGAFANPVHLGEQLFWVCRFALRENDVQVTGRKHGGFESWQRHTAMSVSEFASVDDLVLGELDNNSATNIKQGIFSSKNQRMKHRGIQTQQLCSVGNQGWIEQLNDTAERSHAPSPKISTLGRCLGLIGCTVDLCVYSVCVCVLASQRRCRYCRWTGADQRSNSCTIFSEGSRLCSISSSSPPDVSCRYSSGNKAGCGYANAEREAIVRFAQGAIRSSRWQVEQFDDFVFFPCCKIMR